MAVLLEAGEIHRHMVLTASWGRGSLCDSSGSSDDVKGEKCPCVSRASLKSAQDIGALTWLHHKKGSPVAGCPPCELTSRSTGN